MGRATRLIVAAALGLVCAAGQILVATSKTRDPEFVGTRVLLLYSDRQASVGVILNRPSERKLGEIVPESKAPDEPVWQGGPVAAGLIALMESAVAPPKSKRLGPNLYWISDRAAIARLSAGDRFRVFAGTCGWTARQLADERRAGLWRDEKIGELSWLWSKK